MSFCRDRRETYDSLYHTLPVAKTVLDEMQRGKLRKRKIFVPLDYNLILRHISDNMPKLKQVKIILPYTCMWKGSDCATKIFCITMQRLARYVSRSDSDHFETLVVQNVAQLTLSRVFLNPSDIENSLVVFSALKHLVMAIDTNVLQDDLERFARVMGGIWRLIQECKDLLSLCLIGTKPPCGDSRIVEHPPTLDLRLWHLNALYYGRIPVHQNATYVPPPDIFKSLRFLELKKLNMRARDFVDMITASAGTLTDLYLIEVCLKHSAFANPTLPTHLWLGLSLDENDYDQQTSVWVAFDIRSMIMNGTLKLETLRATLLGYDYINLQHGNDSLDIKLFQETYNYDNFDEAFVRFVMDGQLLPKPPGEATNAIEYDAVTYQRFRNTTSVYMSETDGGFATDTRSLIKYCDSQLEAANKADAAIKEAENEIMDQFANFESAT